MPKKNIIFKNFNLKNKSINQIKDLKKIFKGLLKEENQVLNSLKKNYKNSYSKKLVLRLRKNNKFNLIGMGGSILGARAIYDFMKPRPKKFFFIDSFSNNIKKEKPFKKIINIVISKSGNTLETISNVNTLIDKKNTNIFLTENKKSNLMNIANKLKSEIVYHNNYIGGRYSVLSEVGMLPAELMGLSAEKFRKFNQLILNKYFVNSLIQNVSCTFSLVKKKKFNSIILNYDDGSESLFKWYQQLIAESLGKEGKGIMPIISSMPKDNHSLMQYYLDGTKNHFFTFFYVNEKSSKKIKNKELLNSHYYLKGKSLKDISYSMFTSSQRIFNKKKIPFRSFVLNNRNEETLGELFSFFILETILLGKVMKVDPYNQPAVEMIKKETKNILIRS